MSLPRNSTSSRPRSSSTSKRAHGASTPFPTTENAKFEYPTNANKPPTSPMMASASERKEFAASLHRALRNLKGPFTFKSSYKVPPSILERQVSANATFSSIHSSGSNSASSVKSQPLVDLQHKSREHHHPISTRVELTQKTTYAPYHNASRVH